ncbi:LegC family aminotransferase [Paenibacillus qinlingensis]|uniref:LegC family aminotransferase n=1 Tax=Paenibacillus qinlingensis TaxID=1837343 RepID=UPI001563FC88|nr:LegC family aminotransferase [Paenibacillus qinlingensis]NQX61922.1 LegC family aminotransferase [Paenibacillus qinlingensis]
MTKLAEDIIKAIRDVAAVDEKNPIGLHEPQFSGNEWEYVKDCLDTGWVSTVGQYVTRFEDMISDFTGAKYAIATVNGTAALHICLLLADIRPGDEVLIPTLTFIATANAIAYCGAIPHFVDSDEKTLGISPEKLSEYLKAITVTNKEGCFNRVTGRRIKAVVPMHTFGHAVDLDALLEVCNQFKIVMVEDAAESLGTMYKGKHTGNWGMLSAVSFNGNKVVTTGGGGIILTNHEPLAKLAKHITTTSKIPHKWEISHDYIGYNYRMPNLNAALGCAQIEQLSTFIESKRNLAGAYQSAFHEIEGVDFFEEPEFSRSNYWLNVLMIKEGRALRDQILERTNEVGVMTRPVWQLMHRLTMFAESPRMDLSTAEKLESSIINIPSSVFLRRGNE